MEKVKSSLNELRTVLVSLQTEMQVRPANGSNPTLEKEVALLRSKHEKMNIALSSLISKIETALKE